MAISLPITGGSVLKEYAATSITFSRAVQNIAGVMVPVFTANIAYSRVDYLVQSGVKVGIVNTQVGSFGPGPLAGQQDTYGNIFLDAEKLALLMAEPSDPTKDTFTTLADMADDLIHDDLIARGIISA